MAESKTTYSDAYIVRKGPDKSGKIIYSLVQDVFLIVPGQAVTKNTCEIVGDIVKDLRSEGTYKWNGKKYFYWEYKMTDIENDDVVHTVKYEVPKPDYFGDNFFKPEDTLENLQGDYAKYWFKKYQTAKENFEYKEAIQRRELVLPPTQYVNASGELVKVDEIRVHNNDLGDITNLLGLF